MSPLSCTFDEFKELIDRRMEKAKVLINELELLIVNDRKYIILLYVHDIKIAIFMFVP